MMRWLLLLCLCSFLFTQGCLRSFIVVKVDGDERGTVSHTLLFNAESARQLLEGNPAGVTVQDFFAGSYDVEPLISMSAYRQDTNFSILAIKKVNEGEWAGFTVTAEHQQIRQYMPTWMDITSGGLAWDSTVFHVEGPVANMTPAVHARSFLRPFYQADGPAPTEADVRQFAIMSTLISGLQIRAELQQGNRIDTVFSLNADALIPIVNTNDSVTAELLQMGARSEQQAIDFLAGFPRAALYSPWIEVHAHIKREHRPLEKREPTLAERRQAILNRLSNNTSGRTFANNLPPKMAEQMNEVEREAFTLLPWGGSLESLVKQMRDCGLDVKITPLAGGRKVTVFNHDQLVRRYDLVEHSQYGLLEATEIAWFDEDASSLVGRAREFATQEMTQLNIAFEVLVDKPQEFRARFRDGLSRSMEVYYQVAQEPPMDPSKKFSLRMGRKMFYRN